MAVEYWTIGVECERPLTRSLIKMKHPTDERVTIYPSHVRSEIEGRDPLDVVEFVEVSGLLSAVEALRLCQELKFQPVSIRGRYYPPQDFRTLLPKTEKECEDAAIEVVGKALPWWDDRDMINA